MATRGSLVSLVATFVALAAVVGLLPRVADLLWGPEIAHPYPSQAELAIALIRDLLFCTSVLFAYLTWLQRYFALFVLRFSCTAIAILTLLSPLASIGRYVYAHPVFDPTSSALLATLPWAILVALLFHPNVRDGFDEPVVARFSFRCFLVAALAHVAIFMTASSFLPNTIDTLLLLPGEILVGLVIQFDASNWLPEPVRFFLLEGLGSAVIWACVFALIWPHVWRGRKKQENFSP